MARPNEPDEPDVVDDACECVDEPKLTDEEWEYVLAVEGGGS